MKLTLDTTVKIVLILSFVCIIWFTLTSCSVRKYNKDGCQQHKWYSNKNYHNKPFKN